MLDSAKLYDKHLNQKDSEEFAAIKRMVKMVTNFARTGHVYEQFRFYTFFFNHLLTNYLDF